MSLIQNFPFFSIILCMFSGIITSVMNRKAARWLTLFVTFLVFVMNAVLWRFMLNMGTSYAFMMGHFPAPFGNELQIGPLEAMMATVFSLIMLLTLLSGLWSIDSHIDGKKQNLYFIMMDLVLAALLVMLYTNDLFTAYVFIEINTIAACALIMVRQNGHTLVAATRYLVMNLLASGLTLLGISMLYGITGHLLMPQLKETVAMLYQTDTYRLPLTVVVLLITIGLCIKSALFPFHSWAPGGYSSAPPVSGGILSGLVSKGYIFLLIKFFYRVIGMEVVRGEHILDVLFVFGILGMIVGSVAAIRQKDIRRMIGWSSVAQIGYIYMGIGMGSIAGIAAALFHMLTHAAVKPGLFTSAEMLSEVSGEQKRFRFLRGAGYRNVVAGVAFTIASMSMVGIPLTSGFISKVRLSVAGMELSNVRCFAVLFALAISTLLNSVYFLQTVVSLYRRPVEAESLAPIVHRVPRRALAALMALSLVTVLLGVLSGPFINTIFIGLESFS